MSQKKFSIIACRVFEDELERCRRRLDNQPLELKWFDVSLHITPDAMREKLRELIAQMDKRAESILLLCGLCGNAVLGLKSEDFTLVIPRMHECIAMLLGSNEAYLKLKKENPSCYFASPGWLKSDLLPGGEIYEANRLAYLEKYEDGELVDELMDAFMEQYASYDNYLYADFFGDEEAMRKCAQKAEFMKWRFASMRGDPGFFMDALRGNWDERFLVLEKGAEVSASFDGRIFNG